MFVPFPYLGAVGDVLEGSKVQLGAQDCYIEAKGAYTGAVSIGMLKSTGVKAVLAGHSERRSIFGEDDDTINKKVRAPRGRVHGKTRRGEARRERRGEGEERHGRPWRDRLRVPANTGFCWEGVAVSKPIVYILP